MLIRSRNKWAALSLKDSCVELKSCRVSRLSDDLLSCSSSSKGELVRRICDPAIARSHPISSSSYWSSGRFVQMRTAPSWLPVANMKGSSEARFHAMQVKSPPLAWARTWWSKAPDSWSQMCISPATSGRAWTKAYKWAEWRVWGSYLFQHRVWAHYFFHRNSWVLQNQREP